VCVVDTLRHAETGVLDEDSKNVISADILEHCQALQLTSRWDQRKASKNKSFLLQARQRIRARSRKISTVMVREREYRRTGYSAAKLRIDNKYRGRHWRIKQKVEEKTLFQSLKQKQRSKVLKHISLSLRELQKEELQVAWQAAEEERTSKSRV
jgi:hypothetical protein